MEQDFKNIFDRLDSLIFYSPPKREMIIYTSQKNIDLYNILIKMRLLLENIKINYWKYTSIRCNFVEITFGSKGSLIKARISLDLMIKFYYGTKLMFHSDNIMDYKIIIDSKENPLIWENRSKEYRDKADKLREIAQKSFDETRELTFISVDESYKVVRRIRTEKDNNTYFIK